MIDPARTFVELVVICDRCDGCGCQDCDAAGTVTERVPLQRFADLVAGLDAEQRAELKSAAAAHRAGEL